MGRWIQILYWVLYVCIGYTNASALIHFIQCIRQNMYKIPTLVCFGPLFYSFAPGVTSLAIGNHTFIPVPLKQLLTWWCHQMKTFTALLAICAGNSPVTGEFPSQRPVTRSFDVFFDARLNKRLSKQSSGWRFETPSCSLWRHCNGYNKLQQNR